MKHRSYQYLYSTIFCISIAIVFLLKYVVQNGTFQAEGILQAFIAGLIPSAVFSWMLSHYHVSTNKNAKICALLGLIYGTGFIVVTYVPFYYLNVIFPVIGLKLGFIVYALYILVVSGLVARYFANKSRFDKIKNIKISAGGILAIILLSGFLVIASFATSAYDDYAKRAGVSGALTKIGKIKAVYSEKFASGEISDPDAVGFTALKLSDYGMDGIQRVDVEESERTNASTYEYHIDLTPRQIIITFGRGLEGFSEKTLIVEIKYHYEDGVMDRLDWDCTGGTLSGRYRPSNCSNK